MDLMFLLELKHDSGRFLTLYTRSSGEKCFYVYFITHFHPEFSMYMNGANPWI